MDAFSIGPEPDLLLVDLHTLGEPALQMALAMTAHRAGLVVVALHGANSDPGLLESEEIRGWKLVSKPFLVPDLLGVICSALDPDREFVSPGAAE